MGGYFFLFLLMFLSTCDVLNCASVRQTKPEPGGLDTKKEFNLPGDDQKVIPSEGSKSNDRDIISMDSLHDKISENALKDENEPVDSKIQNNVFSNIKELLNNTYNDPDMIYFIEEKDRNNNNITSDGNKNNGSEIYNDHGAGVLSNDENIVEDNVLGNSNENTTLIKDNNEAYVVNNDDKNNITEDIINNTSYGNASSIQEVNEKEEVDALNEFLNEALNDGELINAGDILDGNDGTFNEDVRDNSTVQKDDTGVNKTWIIPPVISDETDFINTNENSASNSGLQNVQQGINAASSINSDNNMIGIQTRETVAPIVNVQDAEAVSNLASNNEPSKENNNSHSENNNKFTENIVTPKPIVPAGNLLEINKEILNLISSNNGNINPIDIPPIHISQSSFDLMDNSNEILNTSSSNNSQLPLDVNNGTIFNLMDEESPSASQNLVIEILNQNTDEAIKKPTSLVSNNEANVNKQPTSSQINTGIVENVNQNNQGTIDEITTSLGSSDGASFNPVLNPQAPNSQLSGGIVENLNQNNQGGINEIPSSLGFNYGASLNPVLNPQVPNSQLSGGIVENLSQNHQGGINEIPSSLGFNNGASLNPVLNPQAPNSQLSGGLGENLNQNNQAGTFNEISNFVVPDNNQFGVNNVNPAFGPLFPSAGSVENTNLNSQLSNYPGPVNTQLGASFNPAIDAANFGAGTGNNNFGSMAANNGDSNVGTSPSQFGNVLSAISSTFSTIGNFIANGLFGKK